MKAVPFGPVSVMSNDDADLALSMIRTPPKSPRGKPMRLSHIALTIVPKDAKKSKKPKVAFNYIWGDWSGISFWF